MRLRPIALVASAALLATVVTTQLDARENDPDRFFDDAAAAAIPVAEDYLAFALEGDCGPAHALTTLGPSMTVAYCRLARERRRGEWRARPGALRRGCALRNEPFRGVARYDCVAIRLSGRDCSGRMDGEAALNRSREEVLVFMQSTDGGWRVAATSFDRIGSRPSSPIRLCSPEEIRALGTRLASGP
jgi:hypothetical protein